MTKWFRKEAAGLNEDIERHRLKEQELRAKIEELEKLKSIDDLQVRVLQAYRLFLNQLLQSKADVVSKLGK